MSDWNVADFKMTRLSDVLGKGADDGHHKNSNSDNEQTKLVELEGLIEQMKQNGGVLKNEKKKPYRKNESLEHGRIKGKSNKNDDPHDKLLLEIKYGRDELLLLATSPVCKLPPPGWEDVINKLPASTRSAIKKLCQVVIQENSLWPKNQEGLKTVLQSENPPLPKSHIDLLDAVCESVFANWSPGNSELKDRETVMDELAYYIRKTWPSSRLTLYGSSCNGFTFKNSDMDISLTFNGYPCLDGMDEVWIIEKLAEYLNPVMSNVSTVTRTKVPIVKLVHPRTNVEADISLYNELGSENSRMLQLYASLEPRARKLGYMAKLLAKTCSIGDASQGSLSSYAHVLMMIFYLQQVSPPVLPVLQEMYPPGTRKPKRLVGGWNAWFFSPNDMQEMKSRWDGFQSNQMTVGQLWLGFLNFYANEFDSKRLVVSIRQHQPLSKQEKKWSSNSLAIEDPFELNHNLGGTSAAMDSYIKKTFIKTRKLFGTTLEVNILGCQDIEDQFFLAELLTDGPPPVQTCRSCGSTDHRAAKCPQLTCKTCGENGHMATDCEETRKEELNKAFVSACKSGNFGAFDQILELKEININCKRGEGLYWAVRNNRIPIWKTLLDQTDIMVNFTDLDGNTVLHWSCFLNHSDIIEKLLSLTDRKKGDHAIKCNLKNKFGNTALMEAASKGSVESLRIMLACPQVDVFVKRKGKDLEEIIAGKLNGFKLANRIDQERRNSVARIHALVFDEKTRRNSEVEKSKCEINGHQNVNGTMFKASCQKKMNDFLIINNTF